MGEGGPERGGAEWILIRKNRSSAAVNTNTKPLDTERRRDPTCGTSMKLPPSRGGRGMSCGELMKQGGSRRRGMTCRELMERYGLRRADDPMTCGAQMGPTQNGNHPPATGGDTEDTHVETHGDWTAAED
jgi:hypothetical protein